ncbi:hypothetical protein [Nocardia takedensis]|uniref:hypothetical protein n=1 Tax=Nocardia takedensis TaxID=259390 RepID=UPI000594A056|nr:hypothetical protein [Nocardia takedensis]
MTTARVAGAADVVAVICGAREWPGMGERFAPAAAFANTAAELRAYLHSPEGLGLAAADVLWLFDSPTTAVEHLHQIHTFLTARTTRPGAVHGRGLVVVFVYVGHGAFLGGERAYSLLLRDTREPLQAETSLRVSSVASMLRTTVPESARIVILDACFAGGAFKDFQSDITQLSAVKITEALQHSNSSRGVALLCAASARNPARLAGTDTTTLFGRALLDALHTGDPDTAGPMSLRRIGELTTRRLSEVDHAPIPEVHAPDQHNGDLAAKPLFPNAATPTVSAASPDTLPKELRAGLEHPDPEFRRAAVERLATWLASPGPTEVSAATRQLDAFAADDHPAVAALTRTTTFTGHTKRVRPVAFSPDRSSRVGPTNRQRRRYLLEAAVIEQLPVDSGIRIDRLDYGIGPQRVSIDTIGVEPVFLPHRFTLTGTKRRGATAAVFIVSDIAYLGRVTRRWSRSFTLPAELGLGGILPFLDAKAIHRNRVEVARETGELGRLVVVEFRSGVPVARSNHVDLLRRGILDPDDIWISRATGEPILSDEALSAARLAFQSKQPNGNSSDVFACDVDGSRLFNLTRKSFDSYDGFICDGREIVEWLTRGRLQIASQQAGEGVRVVDDPV